MNPAGDGLGFYEGKKVFVYGALPGETVLVRPLKKKRGFIQAKVLEVFDKSPLRRSDQENHYLSCSPWQIINDIDQLQLKKELVLDSFQGNNLEEYPEPKIAASPELWHYRNKMEFSFTTNKIGALSLALHLRGSHKLMAPLNECLIAHQKINQCAQAVVANLQRDNVNCTDLKTLIVRYSYYLDKCLAILYVTRPDFPVFELAPPLVSGFLVVYSKPESPASVTDKVLLQQGNDFLLEELADLKFKYYYDDFFQSNPKGFVQIMDYLQECVLGGDALLDLYAGVGTVGFSLGDKFKKVISLESGRKTSLAAKENVQLNQLISIEVINGLAEKSGLVALFKQVETLVVDPPRAGLHPKVRENILYYGPKKFIYVSCNPLTQAQDLKILQKKYRLVHWRLFDLYPQTPHCESVVIMQRP